MLKSIGAAVMAAIALASAAAAQTAEDRAQVDDIVVTGRRSGVPLWTVRSEQTTLVLVGTIEGISKTTHWDPAALTEALRKADRVMFPEMQEFTASPFRMIGWLAKWNAMGSLPKDQSLGRFATPDDMKRLAALAGRGMVRRDFDRRHPLHLSGELREKAKGDIEYGRTAADYVGRAVKKYKLNLVPISRSKAKPLARDLFSSTPDEHVPCLREAIAMAEAGPQAIQARSDAWAARRVPEVLASPADRIAERCWPYELIAQPRGALTQEMKRLLAEPQVTVAVIRLRTLAEPGGVLDGLAAAGFDIQGPAWK